MSKLVEVTKDKIGTLLTFYGVYMSYCFLYYFKGFLLFYRYISTASLPQSLLFTIDLVLRNFLLRLESLNAPKTFLSLFILLITGIFIFYSVFRLKTCMKNAPVQFGKLIRISIIAFFLKMKKYLDWLLVILIILFILKIAIHDLLLGYVMIAIFALPGLYIILGKKNYIASILLMTIMILITPSFASWCGFKDAQYINIKKGNEIFDTLLVENDCDQDIQKCLEGKVLAEEGDSLLIAIDMKITKVKLDGKKYQIYSLYINEHSQTNGR